jgi:hypothetical protein
MKQSAEPSMPESEIGAHVMPAPADLMPEPEPIIPSVTLPGGETGDKELQSDESSVGLMPESESDASAHVILISMPAPADPEAPVDLMPAPADPEAPVDVMPVPAPIIAMLAADVDESEAAVKLCIAASLESTRPTSKLMTHCPL